MSRCPRCEQRVYFAEEVQVLNNKWHQRCLTCQECNAVVNSTNLCDKDNSIYCKTCYGRLFGPKGYGFGQGAGTLSTEEITPTGSNRVEQKLDQTELKLEQRETGKWCNKCCKNSQVRFCGDCGEPLTSNRPVEQSNDDNIQRVQQYRREATETNPKLKKFGGGKKCVRCKTTVYEAEEVQGPMGAFHKKCFTCSTCNQVLNSLTLCDNEGDIYCKSCYARNFGPKGFGFGAGTLANTE